MQNTVVIKSNRSGMSVYLDPDTPYEKLLEDIRKKFEESEKFWGAVQMTLTLEGRQLTSKEELEIVNVITESSQIEVLCLLDSDENRINRCEKALNDKLMELSSCTGQFYRGTLRRGDTLESEASIVIIGDVNHGAHVAAKGNVIVLGELKGTIHAGISGNRNAVIVAFDMMPKQLGIDTIISKFADNGKKLGKGAMIASIEENKICVKPIKKSFFNVLNSF